MVSLPSYSAHTGILQGEGASCIIFDTGVQEKLVKAGNVNSGREGFDLHVLAQRDDVYFVGAPEDVAAAYEVLRKGFAELDIEVQPTKSEIYAKEVDVDFAADFANKSTEGMIVVGSPIGSKDFIEKEAQVAVHRYPAFFRRLKLMDTQSALLLLRYCGLPMATWLTRTVKPELLQKYAKQFDAEVLETYCHIVDHKGEITPEQEEWIRLPFREGGRGIRSTEKVSPIAYYSSVVGTFEVMRRNLPKLVEQVDILNEKYVVEKKDEEKYVVDEEDEDMNDEVTQDSDEFGFVESLNSFEHQSDAGEILRQDFAKEALSFVWSSANKVFEEHPHHLFPKQVGEVLRGRSSA